MIQFPPFRRLLPGVILFLNLISLITSRAQTPAITVKAGLPASYDLSPNSTSLRVPGSGIQQVVYGNGIYLASAIIPPALFRSGDGKEWSRVFTGPDVTGTDTVFNQGQRPFLAFGAGHFVLASDSGRLFSSPDGLSWTKIDLGTKIKFYDVEYIDQSFYLVGDSSSLFSSPDGINWSRRNTKIGPPGSYYDGILAGNCYLVLDVIHIDTGYMQLVCRSTTGPDGPWSIDTLSAVEGGNLRFLKDHFYKLTSTSQVSTDAHSWTTLYHSGSTVSSPDGFTDGNKVYLLSAVFSGSGSPGNILPTADAGATFEDTIHLSTWSEHGAFFNNNYFVYGLQGMTASTDGLHYHILGSTGSGAAACVNNFVKIGANLDGSYLYSGRDFTTWTGRDTVGKWLPGILYDGTQYLAEGPTIYSSTDGAHWSVKGTSSGPLDHFAYGGGVYVAYSSQIADSLWYSTDGVNWQPAVLPDLSVPRSPDISLGRFLKIRYINGRFFLLTGYGRGNVGFLLLSTDGVHYSFGFPQGLGSKGLFPESFNDIVYNPDSAKYYLIGNGAYGDGTTHFFSQGFTSFDSMGIFIPQDTIRGLPAATLVSFVGETSFSYSHGHFVGVADDITHFAGGYLYNSYMLWSSDGHTWDSHSIGGSTQLISNLASGDIFRMEGTANFELIADFTVPIAPPPPLSIDFNANVFQNSKVFLSWRVSPRREVRKFTIQRSTGTSGWDSIGTIAAQRALGYHFIDNSPIPGTDAYRLLITDTNGLQQYSSIRRVHLGSPVTVWPNPVHDVLNINAGSPARRSYTLCNAFGRPVLRRESDAATLSLFVGRLPPGIYTLFVLEQGSYPSQLQIIHY